MGANDVREGGIQREQEERASEKVKETGQIDIERNKGKKSQSEWKKNGIIDDSINDKRVSYLLHLHFVHIFFIEFSLFIFCFE